MVLTVIIIMGVVLIAGFTFVAIIQHKDIKELDNYLKNNND